MTDILQFIFRGDISTYFGTLLLIIIGISFSKILRKDRR